MQKYFEPKFEEYDLVHMNNRNFVVNMTIDGEKTPAFSATTLDLPDQQFDQTAHIIKQSRENYAIARSSSEAYIHRHYELEANKSAETSHEPKPSKTVEPKPASMGQTAVSSVVEMIKPKRRRRRSKKSASPNLSDSTEHTIFKR
jgi:hypothetical protein